MRCISSFLLTFLFVWLSFETSAQIVVSNAAPYNNPQTLVQSVLLGPGVPFLPAFPAPPNSTQIGLFFNGNSFGLGIDSGIVLISGNAVDAMPGANFSTAFGPTPDADLNSMLNAIGSTNSNINDGAFIEFDFVATGDSLSFEYIFASYEYQGYTCSGFNDPFGFFLTGAGINGVAASRTVNIAQVPNTNPPVPVAVNTLNQGFPSGGYPAANCLTANPNYAISNAFYVGNNSATNINATGYTIPLRAKAQVVCGNLYHIKLAVADVSDNALHSFALIKAKSFRTPSIQFRSSTNHNNSFTDSVSVEGCNANYFVVEKAGNINEALTVHFSKAGSAVEGIDYAYFSDSIHLPSGVRSDSVGIHFYDDGIAEGTESLIINTQLVVTPCFTYQPQSIIFRVRDRQPMTAFINLQQGTDTVDCSGLPIQLFAGSSGGDGQRFSAWDNGSLNPYRWDTVHQTTTYYYHTWDECAADSTTDSLTIYVRQADPLSVFSRGMSVCLGDSVSALIRHTGGIAPVQILWWDGRSDTVRRFLPTETTAYPFRVIDACGEVINDTIWGEVFPPLVASFNPLEDPAIQLGFRFNNFSQNASQYFWNFGDGDTSTSSQPRHSYSRPGTYTVRLTISDDNGCFDITERTIEAKQEFDLFIPNAFTPDADGLNDQFIIRGGGFDSYHLQIYNRWGQMVFETDNFSEWWDGTYNGQAVPNGVYYYQIFLRLPDWRIHSEKGSVTIIR